MQKKIMIGIGVLLLTAAGYVAWSSNVIGGFKNPAQTEAQTILEGFTVATKSQWYCESVSEKGISNDSLWWEQIYLSNDDVGTVASNY